MEHASKNHLWAQNYLSLNGYECDGQGQTVRDRPWAHITCFKTSKGLVYLKSMAPGFENEPIVVQFIRDHISKKVPELIASNRELSCFLMKDAGVPLRDVLNEKLNPKLFCQALKVCAQIQIDSIPHIDQLILRGINDWRLEHIPSLYQTFIAQEELLKTDGLTSSELQILSDQFPKLQSLCNELSEYNIPPTLEHGDFHDNNVLIQNGSLTLNDWGDASVSHPFFSCVSALKSAQKHHSWMRTTELQKAYLDSWKSFENEDRLLKALKLAEKIRFFLFALRFSAVPFCKGGNQPSYRGYMAASLRDFIQN